MNYPVEVEWSLLYNAAQSLLHKVGLLNKVEIFANKSIFLINNKMMEGFYYINNNILMVLKNNIVQNVFIQYSIINAMCTTQRSKIEFQILYMESPRQGPIDDGCYNFLIPKSLKSKRPNRYINVIDRTSLENLLECFEETSF